MTVYASKIMDRAGELLGDEGNDTWTEADKFDWVNAGQREIVRLKPDSHVRVSNLTLAAGITQSVTSDAISLVDVNHNMGTGGATPGPDIQLIESVVMTALVDSWRTDTADAEVQCVMLKEQDPKHFEVYPRQPTSNFGQIEVVESYLPADLVYVDTYDLAIGLTDEYETDLLNYVMAMCRARDAADSPYGKEDALRWYNLFVTGLGRLDIREKMSSPYMSRFQQARITKLPAGVQ